MSECRIVGDGVGPLLDEKRLSRFQHAIGLRGMLLYRFLHGRLVSGADTCSVKELAAAARCSKTELFRTVLPLMERAGLLSFSIEDE